MKKLIFILIFSLFLFACNDSKPVVDKGNEDIQSKPIKVSSIVEAACGQCQFKIEGSNNGCDIAVRINDKAYFADGVEKSQYGNPHGKNGICLEIRKAKVEGTVENSRFVATSFDLIPVD
jgi:hypothetical protein